MFERVCAGGSLVAREELRPGGPRSSIGQEAGDRFWSSLQDAPSERDDDSWVTIVVERGPTSVGKAVPIVRSNSELAVRVMGRPGSFALACCGGRKRQRGEKEQES
jgi:hypothetical protein